jgi:hypothetical protein
MLASLGFYDIFLHVIVNVLKSFTSKHQHDIYLLDFFNEFITINCAEKITTIKTSTPLKIVSY